MSRRTRVERGAATVHAVSGVLVATVAAVVVLQVAALVVVKHRAAAAADLAAIAGSVQAAAGVPGCAAASRVARSNGATLLRCVQTDAVVTVAVESRSPPLWGHRWSVERTARAAPSDWEVPPG